MDPLNLTPKEWSNVLLEGITPETVAKNITNGKFLPWSENLLHFTEDSKEVLDLGCGAGQHSALLAYNGRKMTLLDLSQENLDFSAEVFEILGLNGRFCLADMTRPLSFEDNSFDTVFSCGVFEYFTDEEIKSILKEAYRISKRRIIIMVPNALSVAYRIGYWYMKKTKQWKWGGERPFRTLKPYFRSVENVRFFEFTVAAEHSFNFLTMPRREIIEKLTIRALKLNDNSKPAPFRQGYLLISIGEKGK
jgi:ubiquinone/menaquinone biosynthesis C-methylase UbiE